MARILPKDPDLETEAETYHTWHITDWRKLRRKEHGPIFECAGYPWFVKLFLGETLESQAFSDMALGAFSFSLMATTLNTLPFTSNMRGRKNHRRIGMPASSLLWCCGT